LEYGTFATNFNVFAIERRLRMNVVVYLTQEVNVRTAERKIKHVSDAVTAEWIGHGPTVDNFVNRKLRMSDKN